MFVSTYLYIIMSLVDVEYLIPLIVLIESSRLDLSHM